MRKLFLAMAAVAALFASCSKDDTLTGVSKSKVSFTVSAPELGTRYGEGSEATTLYYAVYDQVEGGLVQGLSQLSGEDFTGGKKDVTLALVEGRTYDIIFYAQNAAESPYYVNWDAKTLNINGEYLDSDKQNKVLTANKETYDAFYAHVDQLKVGNQAIDETVYLKRPFAQLNILTNDTDLAAKAGIEIDQSEVTVKNIYTSMNLFTDEVVGNPVAVTYAMAAIPGDEVTVNTVKYNWLSMNYLLVNEKKMVDVEFKMHDKTVAQNQDANLSRTYTTVAVERNHRTNIYGSIITNPAKFNVEIQAGFLTPDHNVNGSEQYETTVSTAAELQAAITKATGTEVYTETNDKGKVLHKSKSAAGASAVAGRHIIKFSKGITADYIIVPQVEGVDIVIDGADNEFDGTFYLNGNARHTGTETLTFTNINFKHNNGTIDFISCDNGGDGVIRYAHNVTVEDCTFTGNATGDVVGMRYRQCYNMSIINCTINENMHSLMWTTGGNGITIDGVDATADFKEGALSLGTTDNVVIKNCTIDTATGFYGVRVDGSGAYKLTVENSSIKALAPIVVRNTTAAFSVALEGNTLTSTGLYDVIFTNGAYGSADAALTVPTGDWSITGAEGLKVYPKDVVVAYDSTKTAAENGTALYNAIKGSIDGANIHVGAGVFEWKDNSNNRFSNKSFTLIGTTNSKIKVDTKGLVVAGSESKDAIVNVKDITIESGSQAVYAKEYVTVNLYNVTCVTSGSIAMLIDTANPGKDGVKGTINAYNVTIDDGDTVEFMALPCTTVTAPGAVSYTYFNYEGGNIGVCKAQNGAKSTGSNMFVNGVALPAYE